MSLTLILAGTYNILFGIWAVFWPQLWFQWSGMALPEYPEIWQSVGMIVGVYGLGYLAAANNPFRHWPIILVGFLGKIFGPLGFIKAVSDETFPFSAAWIILFNDLIWWIPFAMILWSILQLKVGRPPSRSEAYSLEEAAENYRLSTGETLAQASENQMIALVFLRHFGCTFTRQILRSLTALKKEAEKNGARLVLVHMLQDDNESNYISSNQTTDSIALIPDPHCELYRSFGLGKGGFFELFGPRVWFRGALALFQGCGVGHLAGDGLQMPGAFLFKNSQILSSQPAKSASDLPKLEQLFSAPPSNQPSS